MKVGASCLGDFIEMRIVPSKLPARSASGLRSRQKKSEVNLFMAERKLNFHAMKSKAGKGSLLPARRVVSESGHGNFWLIGRAGQAAGAAGIFCGGAGLCRGGVAAGQRSAVAHQQND